MRDRAIREHTLTRTGLVVGCSCGWEVLNGAGRAPTKIHRRHVEEVEAEETDRSSRQKEGLQKIARAQRAERIERKAVAKSSASANALDRALGYLNAALTELREAEARSGGAVTETNLREKLEREMVDGDLLAQVRGLRDARAERAGFRFDDE